MRRLRLGSGVRKAAGEAEDEKVPFEAKERKVGREEDDSGSSTAEGGE